MKLKTKSLLLSFVVVAAVVFNTTVVYDSIQKLDGYTDRLSALSSFMHEQMALDMMHDAIHGDGILSIQGHIQNNTDIIKNAKESLVEHKAKALASISGLKQFSISDDIIQGLLPIEKDYIAYISSAETLMAAENTQLDTLQKTFEAQFTVLEKSQEALEKKATDEKEALQTLQDNEVATTEKNLILLSIVCILLCLASPLYNWWAVFTPQGVLTDVISRITGGDVGIVVPGEKRNDEIGSLARSIKALAGSVAESYSLKQMVDEMPANVMVLDVKNDFKVTYANQAMRKTLNDIQHLLPIPANSILGSSIDIFHQSPERIRTLLSDKKNLPYRTKMALGKESVALLISSICDHENNYVGAMLNWEMVTAKENLAVEFENNVKKIVDLVSSASEELAQTARGMNKNIEDSASLTASASRISGETFGNVQSVAAATEELSASVQEISGQIQKTTQLIAQSTEKAQNADKLATTLTNASERVNEVMDMIATISSQINLLALNATIESARAGEAGRGFAVVANEVKNLANQTDKSVENIKSVIEEMSAASHAIIDALNDINSSVRQITNATGSVASAIEQQSATTNEIARTMQNASQSTQSVSANLTQASSASGEASQSARQVLDASSDLSKHAEALNGQVENFLKKIRAS